MSFKLCELLSCLSYEHLRCNKYACCFSGKNVLNQKTELQKALEKHKENLLRKELEHQVASETHELEKVIADRARRLQEGTNENKVTRFRFLMISNFSLMSLLISRPKRTRV